MSNLLTEPCIKAEQAPTPEFLIEPARTLRVARLLGAEAVIQLSKELTFADIFNGTVPVSPQSTIFDRTGQRLDAQELVSQIDVQATI